MVVSSTCTACRRGRSNLQSSLYSPFWTCLGEGVGADSLFQGCERSSGGLGDPR